MRIKSHQPQLVHTPRVMIAGPALRQIAWERTMNEASNPETIWNELGPHTLSRQTRPERVNLSLQEQHIASDRAMARLRIFATGVKLERG